MADAQIRLLLRQIRQAFDAQAWHGPNLMSSVRGVTPALAGWRPGPARHSISELVVHAAYWKYRVARLLTDDAPRSFGRRGSNFFPRKAPPTAEEWTADLALVRGWHDRIIEAVEAFPAQALGKPSGRGQFTYADVIGGVAFHDIYHAGQIRLIRRLCEARRGDGQGG